MHLIDKILKRGVVIGIHGLGNKPPKELLEKWWKTSLGEGLANLGYKRTPFSFELVYWADLVHASPLDPDVTNKKSDLYLNDRYIPGKQGSYDGFSPNWIKKKLLDKLEKGIDTIFFQEKSFINYDKIADLVIRGLFKDLNLYYHHVCAVPKCKGLRARDAIRARLSDVLEKYRNRDILLIAHSMGTIIAYDVLTQAVPYIPIHTLITMGSPLGFPVIRKKIFHEQGRDFQKDKLTPSPENIRNKWYNFSDLDDPIALNYNLADDFQKNSRGVGPEDMIICNNYEYKGKKDAHKVYGYLRAPAVSEVIHEFCSIHKAVVVPDLRARIGRLFGKAASP